MSTKRFDINRPLSGVNKKSPAKNGFERDSQPPPSRLQTKTALSERLSPPRSGLFMPPDFEEPTTQASLQEGRTAKRQPQNRKKSKAMEEDLFSISSEEPSSDQTSLVEAPMIVTSSESVSSNSPLENADQSFSSVTVVRSPLSVSMDANPLVVLSPPQSRASTPASAPLVPSWDMALREDVTESRPKKPPTTSAKSITMGSWAQIKAKGLPKETWTTKPREPSRKTTFEYERDKQRDEEADAGLVFNSVDGSLNISSPANAMPSRLRMVQPSLNPSNIPAKPSRPPPNASLSLERLLPSRTPNSGWTVSIGPSPLPPPSLNTPSAPLPSSLSPSSLFSANSSANFPPAVLLGVVDAVDAEAAALEWAHRSQVLLELRAHVRTFGTSHSAAKDPLEQRAALLLAEALLSSSDTVDTVELDRLLKAASAASDLRAAVTWPLHRIAAHGTAPRLDWAVTKLLKHTPHRTDAVQRLFAECDPAGDTPMHIALRRRDRGMVQRILRHAGTAVLHNTHAISGISPIGQYGVAAWNRDFGVALNAVVTPSLVDIGDAALVAIAAHLPGKFLESFLLSCRRIHTALSSDDNWQLLCVLRGRRELIDKATLGPLAGRAAISVKTATWRHIAARKIARWTARRVLIRRLAQIAARSFFMSTDDDDLRRRLVAAAQDRLSTADRVRFDARLLFAEDRVLELQNTLWRFIANAYYRSDSNSYSNSNSNSNKNGNRSDSRFAGLLSRGVSAIRAVLRVAGNIAGSGNGNGGDEPLPLPMPAAQLSRFRLQFGHAANRRLPLLKFTRDTFVIRHVGANCSDPIPYKAKSFKFVIEERETPDYRLSFSPASGTLAIDQSVQITAALIAFTPNFSVEAVVPVRLYFQENSASPRLPFVGSAAADGAADSVTPAGAFLLVVRLQSESRLSSSNHIAEIDYERIRVGEPIGSGAAGVVMKVTLDGQVRAVKKLNVNLSNPQRLAEFRAEMSLLTALDHPCVVRCIGVCARPPNFALVLEYMPHGSLLDVLNRGCAENSGTHPLTWRTALRIAHDIARGLVYLHRLGIVHRDMKSGNVLVRTLDENEIDADLNTAEAVSNVASDDELLSTGSSSEGVAKLTDFGMSRFLSRTRSNRLASMTAAHVGTTRWNAPELLADDRHYDHKVDIWAFGVVLWEMQQVVHNSKGEYQLPYEDLAFDHEVIKAVLRKRRKLAPSSACHPVMQALISRCLSFSPEDRPSAKELAVALEQLRKSEKVALPKGKFLK